MSDNYINESENWKFLPENGRKNPFSVPEGYFEKLSERLIDKVELKEELEEFSRLSAITKKIAFEIPPDYFKSNENALEYQFELSAFKQLDKIKSTLKTNEKEEYFEILDKKLIDKIEIEEEVNEFKLLSKIEKKNNYFVDSEYFETIADHVKEKKYSEVMQPSIIERLIQFMLKPKIALAYSVVIILAIGWSLYYNNSDNKVIPGDCKTLACLEKNELLNEQNMSDFNEDNLYDEVDVEVLDKKLSGTTEQGSDSLINKKDSDSLSKNKK
jgi:hypothetical protein